MKKMILLSLVLLVSASMLRAQTTTELPATRWDDSELFLRWNIPYTLALTPFLGFEWKPSSRVGLLLNGAWSDWSFNNRQTRFKLWQLNPEVRYYLTYCWYVGASGEVGNFDIKPGKKKEGYDSYKSMWAAGLVAGFKARMTARLSLDLNIGLGYAEYKFDHYQVANRTKVITEAHDNRYWWGPYQAGVVLSWRISK